MARNVTYSVAPRINPRDKEAAPKYYGRVQANGDVNIREMSERIQQSCTVHKADVQAVLWALEDVVTDALKGGEIVRLGDLGTLQIGISSAGAVTEEDYNTSLIKKARITSVPASPWQVSSPDSPTRRWRKRQSRRQRTKRKKPAVRT